MTCPACSTQNKEGAKFCTGCGAPLVSRCANCGQPYEPGERFCSECGSPLTAGAVTPAAASAPVAERRLVTVLFADLVGFTALSEARDSEDVRDLLSRYFELASELIARYGGTVEKFIGDAVMAVWGTPVATEDDAERAVRAALELVTSVQALDERLQARAGVLTGEAAVTLGAAGQGMVAGDLVNTASRIQSVAESGSVLVGEATRRSSERAIVYEDAGAHELKGKTNPVALWRASRVVSGVGGSLKSAGLEAPFVGRDRELRLIKELFHASAQDRRAHLVSVTGIAGIGKSRLAWEFYKYFDGIVDTVWWHRGRCLAYGEGVAYWALADMVRMRARIAEDDEPVTAREKLHRTLEEHVPDPQEREFMEPRLAQLLALEEFATGERSDLFAAWRLFFERLADTNPTVLAFEDLQWADASLLDFVEHLLEWSRDYPLYVITLARPELHERRPGWGAGHRNFTSLYLEPLSEEAMTKLLEGLVPGLPDPLRDQILARAEGVPLYAVETVRMLFDRGLLAQEGSVYRVQGQVETLEVPETLQALIAARLDGLSSEERRLLQDGAVLGKTFTRGALAALAGSPEDELEPLLAGLVRKEVLGVQADPRSPEHGQYGFLQDLVRHVAYETLSKRERKARHLSAAAYLESVFTEQDELVEVLASHYLAALEAAPDADDAEAIRTKVTEMLTRAGERAASLAAAAEAQRYFEQAAALASTPFEEATLRERAGQAAFTAGRGHEAETHFAEAMRLWEAVGESHAAARASARLARIQAPLGRLDEAIDRLEESYAALVNDPPDADFVRLVAMLGTMQFWRGDTSGALERLQTALDLSEALWLPDLLAETLIGIGMISIHQRRPEYAHALYRHGLTIAQEHGVSVQVLRAYVHLADLAMQRDRYGEAIALYGEALSVARRVGDRNHEALLVCDSVYALTVAGAWDEALARAAELPESELLSHFALSVTVGLGTIHAARGNAAEASSLLAPWARLEGDPDVQTRTGYAATRALIRRVEGNFVDALASAEEALTGIDVLGFGHQDIKLAFSEALESALALGEHDKVQSFIDRIASLRLGELPPLLAAQSARFRGRLAAARGEAAAAEAGFIEALRVFRGLETPFLLAVAQVEHAEWLAENDRGDEAEPLLLEARETFERLGATPWLERAAATRSVAV